MPQETYAPAPSTAPHATSSLSISVAMATYNGARNVLQQLETLAKQTYPPLEVVVTDDGSTDDTVAIVERFAATSPIPVSVSRNPERLGYANNFLRAVSLCRGDVIAFCDQDDLWRPEKLARCASFFEDPKVVFAIHAALVLRDTELTQTLFPPIRKTEVLEPGTISPFVAAGTEVDSRPGFAMLFRRELLAMVDLEKWPKGLSGHDYLAWFLGSTAGRVALIADPLVEYRQHATNLYGAHAHTAAANLERGTRVPDYAELADYEERCALFLEDAVPRAPSLWRPGMERSLRKLQRRALFHRRRGKLYAAQAGPLGRAGVFTRLLFGGAYLPDRSRTRLGPKAALKDLVFGVGGYRR